MGANDELWQLYQKESSVDVKKQILQAMFVGGNSTRLIELAKSEKDPELRGTAVRNLGLMGGPQTADALLEIYSTDKDPAVKKNVINALFTPGQRDRAGRARAQGDRPRHEEVDRAEVVDDAGQGGHRLHARNPQQVGEAIMIGRHSIPRSRSSRDPVAGRSRRRAAASPHERQGDHASGRQTAVTVVPRRSSARSPTSRGLATASRRSTASA